MEHTQKRKLWIDCFRAIAICLVVTGHVAGNFNVCIYQFHISAFFWLAGLCMNWSRCSKKQIVWERFCTLILPTVLVFLLGVLGMWILNISGIYSIFWGDMTYVGIAAMLYHFFVHGDNYVWWMGAAWFLVRLFQVIVLHAFLLYCVDIRKKWAKMLYGFISVIIYVIGFYYNKTTEGVSDIAMLSIAQLYFSMGVLCRSCDIDWKLIVKVNTRVRTAVLAMGVIFSVIIMKMFSHVKNIKVDYTSGLFDHLVLNILAAINGILLLVCLSKLIERFFGNGRYIPKIIDYVGRNTVGIVFFHFLMFKVCYGILMAFNVIDISYMQNIVPMADNIGGRFFLLFIPVSIAGSIMLWKLCNLTYAGRVLLGNEIGVYRKWYAYIAGRKLAIKINQASMFIAEYVRKCKKQYWSAWSSKPRYEKGIIIGLILMFVADSVLIIRQGCILNDEIGYRLHRMEGFKEMLTWLIGVELHMKRPLRVLAIFNISITFPFRNQYMNRAIMVFLIGLALLIFAYLIIELFEKRRIAYISIGLVLIFLPLTFEHGAPNAFIGFVAIPFIELCLSFILVCKYFKTNKKRYMGVGLLFWIVALGGYEFIVVYTPVFLLLYLWCRAKEERNFRDFIRKVSLPVICGCIYLVMLFALQIILGTGYEGTVIDLTSVSNIWKVDRLLLLSAIPGYFLFNHKYAWLTWLYSRTTGESIAEIFARSGIPADNIFVILKKIIESGLPNGREVGDVFKIIIQVGTDFNILLLLFGTVMFFYYGSCIVNRSKAADCDDDQGVQRKHCWQHIMVVGSIVMYMFLPQLPNAVTKLYQSTVTEDFFIWLPVSFFVFSTVCLCMGYIINLCLERWIRFSLLFMGCLVLFLGIPVQYMNKVVSDTNHRDFERLLMIEELFQTECMKRLERATVYAPDLFETKNLLAVKDNYWDDYTAINGGNMKVSGEQQLEGKQADCQINMVDDSYFCIVCENELAVMSKKMLSDYFVVELGNDLYEVAGSVEYVYDNGFYCYAYEIKDGELSPYSGETIFAEYQYSAGTTLDEAEITGRYEDGWCMRTVTIRVNSGEDGKIVFEGYCPLELTDTDNRNIFVEYDGKKSIEYHVVSEEIYFELSVERNTEYTLKLSSDFQIQSDGDNSRELSYIISKIY